MELKIKGVQGFVESEDLEPVERIRKADIIESFKRNAGTPGVTDKKKRSELSQNIKRLARHGKGRN